LEEARFVFAVVDKYGMFSRFGMRTSGKVEQLSPGGVEPFFIALMLFILGYVVFLLLLFSEDISEMLHKDN
jgi:hypothetical protein